MNRDIMIIGDMFRVLERGDEDVTVFSQSGNPPISLISEKDWCSMIGADTIKDIDFNVKETKFINDNNLKVEEY